MKTILLLFLCLAFCACGEDFTTLKGEQYNAVTVTRVEPDGIVLTTEVGITKLRFTDLPADVGLRYGYDPQKAAAFAEAEAKAARASNAVAAEAMRQEEKKRVESGRDRAEKLAKSSAVQVRIVGRITQAGESGLVVSVNNRFAQPVVSSLQSVGGGGRAYRPEPGTSAGVPDIVFITGHPKASQLALGEIFECVAVRDGVEQFESTAVARYKFVK